MARKPKLDADEAELLRSFEAGEWRASKPTAAERRQWTQAARAALRKDRRLNIRISSRDLEAANGKLREV